MRSGLVVAVVGSVALASFCVFKTWGKPRSVSQTAGTNCTVIEQNFSSSSIPNHPQVFSGMAITEVSSESMGKLDQKCINQIKYMIDCAKKIHAKEGKLIIRFNEWISVPNRLIELSGENSEKNLHNVKRDLQYCVTNFELRLPFNYLTVFQELIHKYRLFLADELSDKGYEHLMKELESVKDQLNSKHSSKAESENEMTNERNSLKSSSSEDVSDVHPELYTPST